MPRRILALFLLLGLLVAGCGSDDNASPGAAPTTGTATASAPAGGDSTTTCPTDNTRAFAKTRFVADVGGSLFLFRRYIFKPYQEGKFQQGADGRTAALIKAGLAGAATVKLVKNASENAKADPTLCKTLAQPLSNISNQLGGIVGQLRSGNFNPAALVGIGGLFDRVQSEAGKNGIQVPEKSVPLG